VRTVLEETLRKAKEEREIGARACRSCIH
jgi:hypothetical protein